jgi:hypothetical protein
MVKIPILISATLRVTVKGYRLSALLSLNIIGIGSKLQTKKFLPNYVLCAGNLGHTSPQKKQYRKTEVAVGSL